MSSNWSSNKRQIKTFIKNAKIFACWHFCIPKWQNKLLLNDDFENEKNYYHLNNLLNQNKLEIIKEIDLIKKWLLSKDTGYHSFKMKNAKDYKLSNVI